MAENKCVCILTAGKGSRLNERTEYFNKALLRVGNKAVISYTIDEFPDDTDFVIVLGYKGDIVQQYLEIAHPEKKFTFVWTDKYSEPGAGPGYAMLQAKEHLQRPFFYIACDSIINWYSDGRSIKDVDWSWAGVAEIPEDQIEIYCTVKIDEKISGWHNKVPNGTTKAFVGVAYIREWEDFWKALQLYPDSTSEGGEWPNAPAILGLQEIYPAQVQWWDTGTEEGLLKARKDFEGIDNLDKLDEELYVVNNSVVKYFHNANMVKHRAQRVEHLRNMTPHLTDVKKNFYKYNFLPGDDLFKLKAPQKVLGIILEQTQLKLWRDVKNLNNMETKIFEDVCKKFYYDKTISRLDKLYKKIDIEDRRPTTKKLFNKINWDYLSQGIPARFHGDFNFSNIVWADMPEGWCFKLLDWRQDFGGSIEYGDVYYDLAKMYHGFLFPHPSVKKGNFYTKKTKGGKIKTFIEVPYEIELCKDIFEEFVEDNGYDLWKVKILTAIVLLNMSPLHEAPIDEYLYYFAKDYLRQVLSE